MKCFKKLGLRLFLKKQYETMEEAESAAERTNSVPNRGRSVRAYRCSVCGYYHVGDARRTKINKNVKQSTK